MASFSGVTFVLFLLRFSSLLALKTRPFVQSSFDMQASRYPHVFFFFFFPLVYLEMSLFPSIFCTISAFSLYGEYVVRSFFPNGVFLPCDHGLDFDITLCVNSINSIKTK